MNYEEAQRVVQQANKIERRQIIETLAGLMTDPVWPLSLILSGLPELEKLFEEEIADKNAKPGQRNAHRTLRRRTRFVNLDPIDLKQDSDALDRGIREYAKLAGVSLALLKPAEMRARLHHAAAHQFGLFWELVVLAIDVCVRSGPARSSQRRTSPTAMPPRRANRSNSIPSRPTTGNSSTPASSRVASKRRTTSRHPTRNP